MKKPIVALWQEKDGVWWWRVGNQRPQKVTPECIALHPWFEKYIKAG